MSPNAAELHIAWQVQRTDGRCYVALREFKGVAYLAIVRERAGQPDTLIGIASGDEVRDFLGGAADVARRLNGAEKFGTDETAEVQAAAGIVGKRRR